eukprot:m.44102 g.44102  ORF g.44102 m.44102 type:complete len:879 (+) comp33493_c1_seq6:40-2676(+)
MTAFRSSSSTDSLPPIGGHGLMEVRESPSGISSTQMKSAQSSRTQLLVARPSTSSAFGDSGARLGKPSSPAVANRQWMHEVAEQVKSLREEIEKKEELLSRLRSDNLLLQSRLKSDQEKFTVDGLCNQLLHHVKEGGESTPRENLPPFILERVVAVVEERKQLAVQVSQWRGKAEASSGELAAENVRSSSLETDLKQTKRRFQEQEGKLESYKTDMEMHQQNSARQTALVQSLRQRIEELESGLRSKTSEMSQHNTISSTIKREAESLKGRVTELEEQLCLQTETVQRSEERVSQTGRKYQSLCQSFGQLLDVEGVGLMSPLDDMLVAKVTRILQDNEHLQSSMATMQASVEASETDARAGRETIMRLVAEVGKEQKAAASCQEQLRKMQLERDTADQQITQLHQELENAKEQLSALQTYCKQLKAESEGKDARLQSLDVQLESVRLSATNADTKYSEVCQQFSGMLNSFGFEVSSHEGAILGKVQEVLIERKNSRPMRDTLENQVGLLSRQVAEHERISSSASEQASQLESKLGDKDEQIEALENEIVAVDSFKDELKKKAEKHKVFVACLCEALQLKDLTSSIGLEINSETILTRAEQLVKQESDAVCEKSSLVYGLQRKVKSMKKELESKELQINLLQRKMTSQDEKIALFYEREKEEDRAIDRAKKMQKQLERASRHINEQKAALTEMKAQLHDVNEFRSQCVEQSQKLKHYESAVEDLSTAKGRLTKQLAAAQRKLDKSASDNKESVDQQQKVTSSLKDDLTATRMAFSESKEREQQLLQFRNALARALGLDLNATNMADYEIVARVERIVEAGNTHLAASRTLESSLLQLGSNFQTSYESAMSLVSPRKHQRAGNSLADIRELPSNFAMKPV